jgi:hypothetical protein
MNEDVSAAVIGRDEAVTLGTIEPFDSAVRHLMSPKNKKGAQQYRHTHQVPSDFHVFRAGLTRNI